MQRRAYLFDFELVLALPAKLFSLSSEAQESERRLAPAWRQCARDARYEQALAPCCYKGTRESSISNLHGFSSSVICGF